LVLQAFGKDENGNPIQGFNTCDMADPDYHVLVRENCSNFYLVNRQQNIGQL